MIRLKNNDLLTLILSLCVVALLATSIFLPWYTYHFEFVTDQKLLDEPSLDDADWKWIFEAQNLSAISTPINVTVYIEEYLHGISITKNYYETNHINTSSLYLPLENNTTTNGSTPMSTHKWHSWSSIRSDSPHLSNMYRAIQILIIMTMTLACLLILVVLLITSTSLLSSRFRLTVAYFRNKLKRFVIYYGIAIFSLIMFPIFYIFRHPKSFRSDWSHLSAKTKMNDVSPTDCVMEVCNSFYDQNAHLGPNNGWKLMILAAFICASMIGVLSYMVFIVKRRQVRRWKRLYTDYQATNNNNNQNRPRTLTNNLQNSLETAPLVTS